MKRDPPRIERTWGLRRGADRLLERVRAGRRSGARAALWALRLSGPVVLAAILVTLLIPRPEAEVTAPAPATAALSMPAPVTQPLPVTPGVCTDPAISGCDSYSACVAAVTMFSGLASDPQGAIAEGLAACSAGAD